MRMSDWSSDVCSSDLLPARVDYRALPRVTFTDPEIAHVGLTETEARERHGDKVRALTWAFAENDRAQAERATEGLVKGLAGERGRDRKSVTWGKGGAVRVSLGGRRVVKKQTRK